MKKKFILIICITLCLIYISGCNNEKSDTTEIEDEPSTEETIDYNMYFESVILKDVENYSLKRIQLDGEILEIIDKYNILCIKNSSILQINIKTQEQSILIENAWNPILSSDKQLILYQNDQGINIYDLLTKETKLIFETNKEIVRNYIISNDSEHVFLQTLDKEGYLNRLITLDGEIVKIDLKEDEQFFITKLVKYFDDKLFVFAEKIEEDQTSGDQISKIKDLMMIDFNKNSIKNITKLELDADIRLLDIYDEYMLIEVVERLFDSDESIRIKRTPYKIEVSNGARFKVNLRDNSTTLMKVISTEKEYIYIAEPETLSVQYPELSVLKLISGSTETAIANITIDIPDKLYYHENQIFFTSNNDMYMITNK